MNEEAVKYPAKETEYKGFRFRSRLEARWAIFLDCMGLEWEYEPEGFELGDGVNYLPDFRIRNVRTFHGLFPELYIEVKGEIKTKDVVKIKKFPKPLYVVGNLPTYNNEDNSLQEMAYGGDCLYYNFNTIDGDNFAAYPGLDTNGQFRLFGDVSNDLVKRDDKATFDAFNKARRARFEYGESSSVFNPAMHKPVEQQVKEDSSQGNDKSDKIGIKDYVQSEWDKACESEIKTSSLKMGSYIWEKITVIAHQEAWSKSEVAQYLLVCGLAFYQIMYGTVKTREEQREEDEQRKTIQHKNN